MWSKGRRFGFFQSVYTTYNASAECGGICTTRVITSRKHFIISSFYPQRPLFCFPFVLARMHAKIDGPRNRCQVRSCCGGKLGRETVFRKQTVPQRHLRRARARLLVPPGRSIVDDWRGKREIEVFDDLVRDPAAVGRAQGGEGFDLLGVSWAFSKAEDNLDWFWGGTFGFFLNMILAVEMLGFLWK